MSRRHVKPYPLPAFVPLPTGNVHVLPAQRDGGDTVTLSLPAARTEQAADADTWVIRDADNVVVDSVVGTRSSAVRQMAIAALRSTSLPLVLYGPSGQPTGDRLPG